MLKIRLARIDDLERILDIIDGAAKWMHENNITVQWTPGNVYMDKAYYTEMILDSVFYVAVLSGNIIGAFHIRWSDKEIWQSLDGNAGYIHHFAIDTNHRGCGYGDIILEWIEKEIEEKNNHFVRLDCIAKNQKLNDYYIKRGYKFIKAYVYSDGKIGNLYEKKINVY